MEYIMSEENEVPTIDNMLDAIYQKNLSQARTHFDTLMADKIGDALENEKINIASQYYNPQEEPEYDESEVPVEDDTESYDDTEYGEYEASAEESEESEEDWGDLESEISNEFEEELEVEV